MLIPFRILEPRTAGDPADEVVIAAAQLVLNTHGYAKGTIRTKPGWLGFETLYFVEVKAEDRKAATKKRKARS